MKMKTTSTWLVAFAWRILIAVCTCTFFQPDEFFQSLEVAHRAVFGYGHLTWEWTTSPPIRSVFFPGLYMPAYWLLKVTGWDIGEALIIAPKVLQGAIAAITDISATVLARQLLGDRYADTAFILSLTSFFHILGLSRTLSNSVETSFTTAALCFWPWQSFGSYKRLQLAFSLAALSCLVRPTAAIIWTFLFIELYWRTRANKEYRKTLYIVTSTTALFAASFLVCIDSLYFGQITFTPLNFVRTNLSPVSLFYGRAPWHYYFTQALPILLNVCLPSFIFGAWDVSKRCLRHQKVAFAAILWTIFVYSLLGHKEWRFLHPILPLMLIFAAKSLVDSRSKSVQKRSNASTSSSKWSLSFVNLRLFIICVLDILPGLYVMRLHGGAQISVMSYLRSLDSSELRSVGFLMPCHSAPWQAYLHRPELSEGCVWALSCEPPLHGLVVSMYADQTDVFYASPITYLKQNFPQSVDASFPLSPRPSSPTHGSIPSVTDSNGRRKPGFPPQESHTWDHRWPSHLVFFGALLESGEEGNAVERYLRGEGYVEVWRMGNGFEEDWRRRGGVRVWKWQGREGEEEDGGSQ